MHLDSHDTPRFRTVTGGGTTAAWISTAVGRSRHLVGLGLQMTMPGVPVVFMGDELGLTAVDGEHARTPFPWNQPDSWDHATLGAYLAWIGLRRALVALRRGGLRWLHARARPMTFPREHPEQTLLVHAVRRGTDAVELPLHALGPDPTLSTLVGAAATTASSTLTLPGEAGVSVHEVG